MFGYQKRYCFTGQLFLKSALHIGGGEAALGASDHPVVRRPDGEPFIPGSSFKGAFRSTVEKMAATIGLWTCALMEDPHCVGPQGAAQTAFNKRLSDSQVRKKLNLLHELNGKLCYTCRLFGSSHLASKFYASDLYLVAGEHLVTQRRDGVAINRDSERAEDKLKFDYEVVPTTIRFDCNLWLENPTSVDLGLVCLGLSEFCAGFAGLGGKRSRGLGNCELQGLKIYELDLEGLDEEKRGARLQKYLLGKTLVEKMETVPDAEKFIQDQITALLATPNLGRPRREGENAHA